MKFYFAVIAMIFSQNVFAESCFCFHGQCVSAAHPEIRCNDQSNCSNTKCDPNLGLVKIEPAS